MILRGFRQPSTCPARYGAPAVFPVIYRKLSATGHSSPRKASNPEQKNSAITAKEQRRPAHQPYKCERNDSDPNMSILDRNTLRSGRVSKLIQLARGVTKADVIMTEVDVVIVAPRSARVAQVRGS